MGWNIGASQASGWDIGAAQAAVVAGGPKTGTGAISMLIPTVAGVGEAGRKTATGAISMLIPTVAGVGAAGVKAATGAVTMLIPTVAGVGTASSGPKTATGAITMLIPIVSGSGPRALQLQYGGRQQATITVVPGTPTDTGIVYTPVVQVTKTAGIAQAQTTYTPPGVTQTLTYTAP